MRLARRGVSDMPIEVGIWRLEHQPQGVALSSLDSESRLEKMLKADIYIPEQQPLFNGKRDG